MDDWKKYGLRSNKNDDGGPMENMGSHSSEQETIRPNNGRMPPVESTTTCIPKHCKKPPTFGFFYQFFWEVLQSASSIGGIEWPELSKGLVWPFLEWKWGIRYYYKIMIGKHRKYILILRNSHFFARQAQAHVWKGNQASNFTLANNMFTTLLTINWGI